jgi:hypothetical protein
MADRNCEVTDQSQAVRYVKDDEDGDLGSMSTFLRFSSATVLVT